MEVGSPEWIEASLAQLDELERERDAKETALEDTDDPAALAQLTAAITQLDTQIKSLYAQLEAVADDEEDEGGGEDEAPVPTQGDDELSAPHIAPEPAAAAAPEPAAAAAPAPEPAPAPAPVAAPMAAPVAQAAESPFGSPSSDFGGGGGGFDSPAAVVITDDDLKPKGGGAKWAFLIVVLLGGAGVGGYFVWQNMQAQKPAQTGPAEPEKVIKAAGVPDDTEAPPTAPSGHATISPNATQSSDSASNKKKKKEEEDKPKPITLKDGEGPL